MEFIDAGCDSRQVVSFMSPEALFRKRYILKKRHVDFDMCCVMRDLPTVFVEEQYRAFLDWGYSVSAVASFMSSDYIEDHMSELEELGLSFRDFIQILASKDEKYWLTWNKESLRDRAPSLEDLEFLNNILERAA